MNRPAVVSSNGWQFPRPERRTLTNGVVVWLFDLPGQHITTFEAVIPADLASEPRDAEGLGTVALHAIDEGSVSHPDGQIGELLEAYGAGLHGSARLRYTTFGGQAPTRQLHEVLPLYIEALATPDYAERDIAHHIEAQIAGYDSTLASPGSATKLALRRALFGPGSRSGRPIPGSPETLETIDSAAVRAWHRDKFIPEGATIIIAGDLTAHPVELDSLLEWQQPSPTASEGVPLPATQAPSTVVVNQPGAVQATISAGLRTPTRTDPRWASLRVAGHCLAGAFASRLNLELRERLGYTYGIHGGFAAGISEALFTVGGSVRTEVAGDAIKRLLDGASLPDDLNPAEVEDAKRYLVSVSPLANETSADIVSQASALAAAGLDPEFLNRHFDEVAMVDAEQATAAYREVVGSQQLTLAVTGDATELVPALEQAGLNPVVVDLRN